MEILDNRDEWFTKYQDGWVAHLKATGEKDWTIYNRNLPNNAAAPEGPGINLSESRLVLITSAGGYLRDSQQPFDDNDPFGDYTMRMFPSSTSLDKLAIAHGNYDHAAVEQDRQVLIPLRHLDELVNEGVIGEMADSVISFAGYQPDATRVVDELIPSILEAVQKEKANGALLVPA